MGQKKGTKSSDFTVYGGVAMHKNQLVKSFEAGELVWKKDVDKKKSTDRQKLDQLAKGYIKILFLDRYMTMPHKKQSISPSVNGAIELLLKRTATGHYPFKTLSAKFPSIGGLEKDGSKHKAEKKFIESQIRSQLGNKPEIDKYIRDELYEPADGDE